MGAHKQRAQKVAYSNGEGFFSPHTMHCYSLWKTFGDPHQKNKCPIPRVLRSEMTWLNLNYKSWPRCLFAFPSFFMYYSFVWINPENKIALPNPETNLALLPDKGFLIEMKLRAKYSQSSYFGTNAPYKWHHISLKLIFLNQFFSEGET